MGDESLTMISLFPIATFRGVVRHFTGIRRRILSPKHPHTNPSCVYNPDRSARPWARGVTIPSQGTAMFLGHLPHCQAHQIIKTSTLILALTPILTPALITTVLVVHRTGHINSHPDLKRANGKNVKRVVVGFDLTQGKR